MSDDQVIDDAYADGFTLEERVASYTQNWGWGFVRGEDDRWPIFLERDDAISWMADRLHRIEVFR